MSAAASEEKLPDITGRSWLRRVLDKIAGPGLRRRKWTVWGELGAVVAFCSLGFYFLLDTVRSWEIAGIVGSLQLLGVQTTALGNSIVLEGPDGFITATMTASCSALLAVLALVALAGSVLRAGGLRTVIAVILASAFVIVMNAVRIGLSILVGTQVGAPALVLFHDWVGTIINFAFTLIGFIFMVWIILPPLQRAEQDKYGRHTARRPLHWARPGLGYRAAAIDERRPGGTVSRVAWLYKLMPSALRKRSVARREAGRVDFRVGDLPPASRAAALRDLASDGLAVHTATLWAAACYEEDPDVLDALADAVAARQWEPVVNDKVAGLRLWARAWLAGRPATSAIVQEPQSDSPLGAGFRFLVTGAGGPAGVAVIRRLRKLGFFVIGADSSANAVGLSLADSAAVLPRADDAKYLDALLTQAKERSVDAVVFTTVEELKVAAANRGSFAASGLAIWVPELEALELADDKWAFAQALDKWAIPHPASTIDKDGLEDVPGPWVVKPVHGRGSRGVRYSASREEVEAALKSGDMIAQSQLIGQEFTCDVLVDPEGRLLAAVPRWRQATRGGISVEGETFSDEEQIQAVCQICDQVMSALGLDGPACVQGFIGENGVVVMEVNPRFSGGLPLTLAAGADVVGAYAKLVLDRADRLDELTWTPGVKMTRHFSEVFFDAQGRRLPDPAASIRVGPASAAVTKEP